MLLAIFYHPSNVLGNGRCTLVLTSDRPKPGIGGYYFYSTISLHLEGSSHHRKFLGRIFYSRTFVTDLILRMVAPWSKKVLEQKALLLVMSCKCVAAYTCGSNMPASIVQL